jgi:hypothetical protein
LLLRFADVAALHTPRLSLINHLTSPLARAWQGHQARPRCGVCISSSHSTPTAEQKIILAHGRVFAQTIVPISSGIIKGRATAALGIRFRSSRATLRFAFPPSTLPAGRATRSAETRLTVNKFDTSRRQGRERKSHTLRHQPVNTTAWLQRSGSQGQGAPQLRLPRPCLWHLLKAPRLVLAAGVKCSMFFKSFAGGLGSNARL